MTEAVILELIAYGDNVAKYIATIVIIGMILKIAPNHLNIDAWFGKVEVDFNHEADK